VIFGVFLPALMGVGILASAMLLVMDGIRRFVPASGVRRKVRTARAVHGIVAGAARAAGRSVPEPGLFRRVARSRWTYVVWGTITAGIAVYVIRLALVRYFDEADVFYENAWLLVIALAVLVVLGPIAAITFAPGLIAPERPRFLRRIIEHSWLGRFDIPEHYDRPELWARAHDRHDRGGMDD
jgi:hypothetical protein